MRNQPHVTRTCIPCPCYMFYSFNGITAIVSLESPFPHIVLEMSVIETTIWLARCTKKLCFVTYGENNMNRVLSLKVSLSLKSLILCFTELFVQQSDMKLYSCKRLKPKYYNRCILFPLFVCYGLFCLMIYWFTFGMWKKFIEKH